MWLTLDIGNSSLKGGLFDACAPVHTWRAAHLPPDARAWEEALRPHLAGRRILRTGMASVVPALTGPVEQAVMRLTGRAPLLIGPALALPFTLAYETPGTLGTDRLAAAAAAWTRYGQPDGRPVVALDAGTAVTYEVVEADGVYRGGAIGAGPELLRRALSRDTAQLPEVPPTLPPGPVGRNTREAIQAGLMYGFVDGVAGMLRRLAIALPAKPRVVATGGWAPFLARHIESVETVEPDLVLMGILDLMRLNP